MFTIFVLFSSNSSLFIVIPSESYCFNISRLGNLKFPNSKVGSTSPKFLTSSFALLSDSDFSNFISSISISIFSELSFLISLSILSEFSTKESN